jgi:oxygen-independent coproporphyrinogen-3 oxidase
LASEDFMIRMPLVPTDEGEARTPASGVVGRVAHATAASPWAADACGQGAALPCHSGRVAVYGPLIDAAFQTPSASAAAQYLQALRALSTRPDEAISLSLRLPFCPAHCLFCDREIRAAQPAEVIDDYVSGLIAEIQALGEQVGRGRDVLQLHLGGGAANELGESQLLRLMQALASTWRLPSDAEMSVECDPRRVGWMQLRQLRGLGFRQVTYGVHDLDPTVQRAIGRLHSVALIDDVCDLTRACDIEYINLKMMVGLPHQNERRWRATIERVIAMAPDRVTLARYRHRPWHAPAQQTIDADALPGAEQCQQLSTLAADLLCEAGYRWIGVDEFVLDTDELALAHEQGRLRRSMIGYTATPPTPQLGLGVGAIGEIDGSVFCNEAAMPLWREAVRGGGLPVVHAHRATAREAQRRRAVEHLLCWQELPFALARGEFEDAYHRLAQYEGQGVVRVQSDRIVITEAGRHRLLALCGEFDGLPAAGDRGGAHWLS